MCLAGTYSFGQTAFDQHFGDWASDPDFSIVNVSPKMLKMMTEMKAETLDASTESVLSSLKQLKTAQYQGDKSREHHATVKKTLLNNNFDELLQLQRDGYNISILARDILGNVVQELVTLKSNASTLYISDMVGDIDLSKVSKLSGALNAPGMELLDEIKRN